jgi:hypothetical protein
VNSLALVAIDAAGFHVLLVIDRAAILRREVSIVLGAHTTLFLVDARFLVLQARGLAG